MSKREKKKKNNNIYYLSHCQGLPDWSTGELYQHYREGQEDQLGALGLVLNIIVLWNTIYMNAALEQLRRDGFQVRDEDVARLSPLIYSHINMLGQYSFSVPDAVIKGKLRAAKTDFMISLSTLSVPLLLEPLIRLLRISKRN